jgi:hypothetical protein
MDKGLSLDLTAHGVSSLAYWLQAETKRAPQVLYADAAIEQLDEAVVNGRLTITMQGKPKATGRLVVAKPSQNGVENRKIQLDDSGRGASVFDDTTINEPAQPVTLAPPATAKPVPSGLARGGNWPGHCGKTAAWLAGADAIKAEQNGFRLTTDAQVFTWAATADPADGRVPLSSAEPTAGRRAACWTAVQKFGLTLVAPDALPYRLTVYLLDYDRNGRAEQASITGRDGTVLDTQTAEAVATGDGVYLSWIVTGAIGLEISKTAGFNTVASAVFIDPK